ncbi:uncharacterized protein LOC128201063 [Galleria mellonella]|uniref:Uncharacterized protein LOC128201063 n=1 Tax=Galleria mellonella TaxID=7137 RepID=A0ABM3MML7_GALME|nr:uncharacterized protein LOC128201063 [Galleria mellonella]
MCALERSFASPEMIVFSEVQLLKSLPRLGNDLKELSTIANKVRNSLSTIKLLNHSEYLHSPELFHVILGKLNPNTKMRWSDYASEFSRSNPHLSKLEVLSQFLTREHERHTNFALSPELALSLATQQLHVGQVANKQFRREIIHSTSQSKIKTNSKIGCVYCKKNHNITSCEEFKILSVDERWSWLREFKVCYRCLRRSSHLWKTCKVNPCGINGCSFRHHPLLHGRQDTSISPPAPDTLHINDTVCATATQDVSSPSTTAPLEDKVIISNTGVWQTEHSPSTSNVLLKVLPITIFGPTGSLDTYALLDDGSTATLIDASVATQIGLSGPQEPITVNGIGGLHKNTTINYVDFHIKGKFMSDIYLVKRARAMMSISLHAQSLSKETLTSYSHLCDLADFLTYNNATPTVLIGAEDWHLSITREVRIGKRNEPVACRTLLGWTLYGISCSKTKPIEFINHCQFLDKTDISDDERLELLVKEQYKIDSLGISKRETLHSKQDLRALEILEFTAKRLPTGRFEVGLPWRDNIKQILDSYSQAMSRFLTLERRMNRERDFAEAYRKFIDNMIVKEYAEECKPITYYNCNRISTSDSLHYKNSSAQNYRLYLPHFGVYHPQKRKLRVVHDAAATNQGVSLNSLLLQGPDLLENLVGILFRFREGRIALTADIKEMFPQIRIREQDRDALRFLWRYNSIKDAPLKEYRMCAVIFGATSSPFIALYIKNKNAIFYQDRYPEAVDAIIHDHYTRPRMDDYLGSLDNEDQAAQLAFDIVTVHSKACFEMRGWLSNNKEALRLIPEELRAAHAEEVPLGNTSSSIKVLGVSWDPSTDLIGFRTGLENFTLGTNLNKRKVLSHLMKVYDPLGLLGPIVGKGRILLQDVWRSNIDWDTPFSPSEVSKWTEWFKELFDVSTIKIPRWYAKQNGEPLHRELHVFADASELAYACVAYWRFLYPDGCVKLALIASKTRVSPLKPTSIPRWLRSDARSFKPFVAHRIGEISENSRIQDWRWVPTSLNVADDATRTKPLNLNSNHRWFTGPPFLLGSPKDWPVEPAGQPMVQEERRQQLDPLAVHVLIIADFTRFSDWLRLLRVTARVLQVVSKFRSLLDRSISGTKNFIYTRYRNSSASTTLISLTAELMKAAERHVLQRVQQDSFREEIQCITRSQPIAKSSRLSKLSPMMGEDNLLRLYGRIKAVQNVDTDVRFPILLDGHHPVVRLLVQYFHRKAGHANNETVINEIRQQYWLLHLRNTVRSVAYQCCFCRIRKTKPLNPVTGNLPPHRLAHHRRPFTFTGLDYFGPINVTIGRRHDKRYVALFTCLTSRAVHLESICPQPLC